MPQDTQQNPGKKLPRVVLPVSRSDTETARLKRKIALTIPSDSHYKRSEEVLNKIRNTLEGDHSSRNIVRKRSQLMQLHLDDLKTLLTDHQELQHENMGHYLSAVNTAPPSTGIKYHSRGKQREQDRAYQQQKGLRQIAHHLEDQTKLGVDERDHLEFLKRQPLLLQQLGRHALAHTLREDPEKAKRDANYREQLTTTIKEALTTLATEATTLRQQHEKETKNKARARFQSALANNPQRQPTGPSQGRKGKAAVLTQYSRTQQSETQPPIKS
jgi:hypothetical protein